MQRHRTAVDVVDHNGQRQMDMFVLEEGMLKPNIIFVIEDIPGEPIEYYPTFTNHYFNIQVIHSLLDEGEFRYVDEVVEKARRKGKLTVQTSISKLEMLEHILCDAYEVAALAEQYGEDPHSINFLTYALSAVETLSVSRPHDRGYDWGEAGENERERFFDIVFSEWEEIKSMGQEVNYEYFKTKYPTLDYAKRSQIFRLTIFIDSLATTWAGVQMHLCEQMIRDYIYIGTHSDCLNIEYFRRRYPTKSEEEVQRIFDCIKYAAEVYQFNLYDGFGAFESAFIVMLESFFMQPNSSLSENQMQRIWASEHNLSKIKKITAKWRNIFYRMWDESGELDKIFTMGIVEKYVRQGKLPAEMATESNEATTANEVRVKATIRFPDGFRAFLECIFDRIVWNKNGLMEIHDWKTSFKPMSELSDIEKLQVALQIIIGKRLMELLKSGHAYMVDQDGYKFYMIDITIDENTDWSDLPRYYHRPEEVPHDAETNALFRQNAVIESGFLEGDFLEASADGSFNQEFALLEQVLSSSQINYFLTHFHELIKAFIFNKEDINSILKDIKDRRKDSPRAMLTGTPEVDSEMEPVEEQEA